MINKYSSSVPHCEDINVLALFKGNEKYLFLYTDANRLALLTLLGEYALDPDLSFSWSDADTLVEAMEKISAHTS